MNIYSVSFRVNYLEGVTAEDQTIVYAKDEPEAHRLTTSLIRRTWGLAAEDEVVCTGTDILLTDVVNKVKKEMA